VRKLWRGIRLLPVLPARLRAELMALRQMEAELSRLASRLPVPTEWTAPLAELTSRLHAEHLNQLACLLGRWQAEHAAVLHGEQAGHASELAAVLRLAHGEHAARVADLLQRGQAEQASQVAALLQRGQAEYAAQLCSVTGRMHADLHEMLVLLDYVGRQGRRTAALAAMNSRHPPATARAEGVSMLIPCWNQGCFLAAAVESARASLDALAVPGEILILDDASRDQTRATAQELAHGDPCVRLLASDENLGLPRARNILLTQARYEHAILLDADNRLVPAAVPALYQAARDTGAVLVYGNVAVVDESGQVLGMVSNERATAELLDGNYIDALALLRTARVLELHGYDADARLPGLEDWELNVRLLHLGEPLAFVPTLVGLYRYSRLSMNHDTTSYRERARRVRRSYGLDGPPPPHAVRGSVYHPATGYLWRSPAWPTADRPPGPSVEHRTTAAVPRILVVSSGGVRNHGDDAILLSMLQRLQRVRPGCIPVVVSDGEDVPPLGRLGVWAGTLDEVCRSLDAVSIRRGCQGHSALNDLAQLVGAVGSSAAFAPVDLAAFDCVLFAGGGNLTDQFTELTARRAAVAAAALDHGLPYVMSGQGVGPVASRTEAMVALLAAGAQRFGVRDPLSAACVRGLPLGCASVDLVGDDSLGLARPGQDEVDTVLQEIGVPPGLPLLGFHAREAGYVGCCRDDLLAAAAQADELAAAAGQAVLCIPINTQPWAPEFPLLAGLVSGLKRRRARWFLLDCRDRVGLIAAVAGRCEAIVSHSYHLALFALTQGVPAVLRAATPYYRFKADGLRQFFGIAGEVALSGDTDVRALARQIQSMTEQPWSPVGDSAGLDQWLDEAIRTAAPGRKLRRTA
jgi:polysaccharide pyruvyl transferase WcaK-like protein/GT2 family glycosyltransferase